MDATHDGWFRIGELSRRVGVSDHVLRAWERRYGLLAPVRSSGGFRLYSLDDERRVRLMQGHLTHGLSAAEAARAALAEVDPLDDAAARGSASPVDVPATPDAPAGPLQPDDARRRLTAALTAMDEPAAQHVLDEVLRPELVEDALQSVVLPFLQDLGRRWERGEVTIAQEHFASNVLRGRLTSLAQGWGAGTGPRALLACPPGERHELALLAFGVVLARRGWAVDYLGSDTPVVSVAETAVRLRPAAVVLAATDPERFRAAARDLAGLAPSRVDDVDGTRSTRLLLAGAGASAGLAAALGAELLDEDPVTAARALAASDVAQTTG